MNALNKAIELSGGTQQSLADRINKLGYPSNVKQQHVSHWSRNGIPRWVVPYISKAVNGEITEADLHCYKPEEV